MQDTTINLSLHPRQLDVFQSEERFKVVVAGRRFGKSHLACAFTVTEALKTELNGYDLTDKGVYYVAPTFDQAKRIAWSLIKRMLAPLGPLRTLENTGRIELPNGRWIEIKGSDKPDTLRGVGLSAVVLDEYASMRPDVWTEIIRPALADVQGKALFIGTPQGRNHAYELFLEAEADKTGEWRAWQFHSVDNPFLDPVEIKKAAANMTAAQFNQEFLASFAGTGASLLRQDWVKMELEPPGPGYYAMAVDLAGFVDAAESVKYKRTDNSAIAIVKVHAGGWHVKDIRFGKWGVRECAVQMLKAAKDYDIRRFGIEKGMAMNAVMPYLTDRMRAISFYPEVVPLVHGGKKKVDRIMWALAGRLEKGRMTFELGAPWMGQFMDEYSAFPNELAKDDLLDSLAYIDQLSDDTFEDVATIEEDGAWQPLDADAGY